MISIYEIGVAENKIMFSGMCDETVTIDRLEIYSTSHPLHIGFVELSVCDQLLYKGPYPWFSNGGMNFSLSKYFNFKVVCTAFDENDKWFHGSNARLYLRHQNGNIISTIHKGRFDSFVK